MSFCLPADIFGTLFFPPKKERKVGIESAVGSKQHRAETDGVVFVVLSFFRT